MDWSMWLNAGQFVLCSLTVALVAWFLSRRYYTKHPHLLHPQEKSAISGYMKPPKKCPPHRWGKWKRLTGSGIYVNTQQRRCFDCGLQERRTVHA